MLTRDLVMPLFVVGAVGLPVLLSAPDAPSAAGRGWLNTSVHQPGMPAIPGQLPPGLFPGQVPQAGGWVFPGDANGPDFSSGPLEFMPISDLGQVFSYSLTVADIRSRFQRVALVSSEQGWQGYRTELVTGTGPSDLHGCMTWYFDAKGTLQRISFRGWTGNPGQLRQLLQDQFLLKVQAGSQWTETLTLSSWGKTSCAAIFQLPQVVRNDLPQQQIAALVELNRFSSQEVSAPMREALRSGSW